MPLQLEVRHWLTIGDCREPVGSRFFRKLIGQRDIDAQQVVQTPLDLQVGEASTAYATVFGPDSTLLRGQPLANLLDEGLPLGGFYFRGILRRHLAKPDTIDGSNPACRCVAGLNVTGERFHIESALGRSLRMTVAAVRRDEFLHVARNIGDGAAHEKPESQVRSNHQGKSMDHDSRWSSRDKKRDRQRQCCAHDCRRISPKSACSTARIREVARSTVVLTCARRVVGTRYHCGFRRNPPTVKMCTALPAKAAGGRTFRIPQRNRLVMGIARPVMTNQAALVCQTVVMCHVLKATTQNLKQMWQH